MLLWENIRQLWVFNRGDLNISASAVHKKEGEWTGEAEIRTRKKLSHWYVCVCVCGGGGGCLCARARARSDETDVE